MVKKILREKRVTDTKISQKKSRERYNANRIYVEKDVSALQLLYLK